MVVCPKGREQFAKLRILVRVQAPPFLLNFCSAVRAIEN